MRVLMALVSSVIVVAAVTGGPAVVAQKTSASQIDAPELYKTNCQACHGPAGESPLEPLSFVDDAWKHGSRLQDIVKIVTDGVEMTPMLPFKEKLTKEEILAVAKLVRSFDKSLTSKKAPAGKTVKK
jgi:mono/diheme cytochrome c family protein